MRARRTLEWLVRAVARRPAVTLGIVLALALGGGALALRLTPNTNTDTFVSRSSPTYQASLDDERHFGGDGPRPGQDDGQLERSRPGHHVRLPRALPQLLRRVGQGGIRAVQRKLQAAHRDRLPEALRAGDLLDALATTVVELARHDRRREPRVAYVPRRDDVADDPAQAPEHVPRAEFRRELRRRVDPVL